MINKPELTPIIEEEKSTNVEFNQHIFEKTPKKSFIKSFSNNVKKLFSYRQNKHLAPDFDFMPKQHNTNAVECNSYYDYQGSIGKAADLIMHAGLFTVFYAFILHHFGFASYQDQLMMLNKPEASGISLMIFGIVHASYIIYKKISERKTHADNKITAFDSIWGPFNTVFITLFFLPLAGNSSLFIDFTRIMITLTSKLL